MPRSNCEGFEVNINDEPAFESLTERLPVKFSGEPLMYFGVYPGSSEDSRIVLTDEFYSLPLGSRNVEEMLDDYQNEAAIRASQERSLARRKPARYKSELVVELLDDIDDRIGTLTQKVGETSLKQIRILANMDGYPLDHQAD